MVVHCALVEPREAVGESVQLLLKEEANRKVNQIDYYRDFADRA